MKRIIASLTLAATLLVMVLVLPVNASAGQYIEQAGSLICSRLYPDGAGSSKNLRVLKDGFIPNTTPSTDTTTNLLYQYNTYYSSAAGKVAHVDYFGYVFDQVYTLTQFEYTEGILYSNGGWFANGSAGIDVRINGEWVRVASTSSPAYPAGNTRTLFGDNYDSYTFTFDPVQCDGIRISGDAGGTNFFVSASELRVVAVSDTPLEITTPEYRAGLARAEEGFIEGISKPITNTVPTPTSGGSQNVYTINDGVTVALDNTNNRLQFDTYTLTNKTSFEEYLGYEFPGTFKVKQLIFQSGKLFANGGWFANGSLSVQVLKSGVWSTIESTITPAYPNSNDLAAFVSFSTYTVDFESVECDGIRIYGTAGGTKYYISCTELTVVADTDRQIGYPSGITQKDGMILMMNGKNVTSQAQFTADGFTLSVPHARVGSALQILVPKSGGDSMEYDNHVYFIKDNNGAVDIAEQPALKNMLAYEGVAIRTSADQGQGLRLKSNLSLALRQNTSDEYTIAEYGTLAKRNDNPAQLEYISAVNDPATRIGKGVAFDGTVDYIYSSENGRLSFTSVLIGISAENYTTDYDFRAYCVVECGGETYYVYGNTVTKNIRGIALQVMSDTAYFNTLSAEAQAYITLVAGN